jgi:hypothetical protein
MFFKRTNKLNHSLALGVLLAVSAFSASSVQATVVYDNGITTADDASQSDVHVSSYRADDFTLSSGAATFDTVSLSGMYFNGNTPQATDVFTIELFADNGSGLPATTALASYAVGNAVNRTDSGTMLFSAYNIYDYSATIASTALTAGQPYWLSVVNDTTADNNDNWFWARNSGGNAVVRGNTSGTFSLSSSRLDFSLSNNSASVPEPTTFGLLGLGMASLLLNRRKARG